MLTLEQDGYEATTVARITSRARVSRRTFYELFDNRERCIAAVLRDAAAWVERELRAAELEGLPWRERMRRGLWTILCCLDREPALARVALVHTARGGGEVLACREAISRRLVAAVDEGRREGARGGRCSELTAEGVVGAALAIVRAQLERDGDAQLSDLFAELLGIVTLPYEGAAVTQREQSRPTPTPAPQRPSRTRPRGADGARDVFAGLNMRLTYRTARVLAGIGEHPGASNRQVADHAGIADQGQISKLLARLERVGLLANVGEGHAQGEPNAWMLTPTGAQVAHAIAAHVNPTAGRRAA